MHESVVRLLKAQDEDSLEILPRSGTDLDPEEPKVTETEGGVVKEVKIALFIKMRFSPLQPQMEQSSDHMNNLVRERKTSPRTGLWSQDVLDVREVNI